jgi:site-specific DNA-cytosine methylase
MMDAGLPCLPPIDNVASQRVPEPLDVLTSTHLDKVRKWVQAGAVRLVHCGTPCTTFSQARRLDAGPPPLRSPEHLLGLPHLGPRDRLKVEQGNKFFDLTVELIHLNKYGYWSIENPCSSMAWMLPALQKLAQLGAQTHTFDSCAYGAPWKKPTSFMTNVPQLQALDHGTTPTWP